MNNKLKIKSPVSLAEQNGENKNDVLTKKGECNIKVPAIKNKKISNEFTSLKIIAFAVQDKVQTTITDLWGKGGTSYAS